MRTTIVSVLLGLVLLFSSTSLAPAWDIDQGFLQLAQNCCNCSPYDTDLQCGMACNAMIPRCTPQRPRPAPAPQQQSSGYTIYCCANGQRYANRNMYLGYYHYRIGQPCRISFFLQGVGCE